MANHFLDIFGILFDEGLVEKHQNPNLLSAG